VNRVTPRAVIVTVAIAALLSIVVTVVKAPLPGDVWVLQQVQRLDWLERPSEFINRIGDFDLLMLIGVAGAMALEVRSGSSWQRTGLFVAGAFILATALMPLDQVLKEVVRSPRPSPADGVEVDMARTTYGFPSGHTYTFTLLLGLAAATTARLKRPNARWWRLAALVVIPAGGIARLVVGAHWPSDVLGGWLWGAAAVLACLYAGQEAQRRLARTEGVRGRRVRR
jgi:membrane-associated phospholipid phosphatase